MAPHVCPWWGGYFIDNRFRRWLHNPQAILSGHVRPGMTILDFGCGMGFFAIAMAQLAGPSCRVIAADLQQQMLDVLMKRANKANVADRIVPHLCASDTLQLDASIQFALAFYSAHEAPDQSKLLTEIANLLIPGGRLLVVEPVGHVTKRDFGQLLAKSEAAGFQVTDRPQVRWSHAVLLAKPTAAGSP